MAHSEACQLFIEEQIKEGLAEGKTPYSIGKELTAMIERLFEASIPAKTLEKRAQRIDEKIKTNVFNPSTPENVLTIPDNQVSHGGKRLGAGAPQKYEKPKPSPIQFTNALHIATFVISHLERIMPDDPNRFEALDRVSTWIEENQ